MKPVFKIVWLSACTLVLIYWINIYFFSTDMPDAQKTEAQGILLLWMIVFSFPTGVLWYLAFSFLLLGLDVIGVFRSIPAEVGIAWIGFVIAGYLQWFVYGPGLIDKFVKWKQS